MLPELPAAQAQDVNHKLIDTYGKVYNNMEPEGYIASFSNLSRTSTTFIRGECNYHSVSPWRIPISGQLQPDFKILNESLIFYFRAIQIVINQVTSSKYQNFTLSKNVADSIGYYS